jgi:hypothetical protein
LKKTLGFRALWCLAAVVAASALAATASAQLGHPLKGTWSGDWGPDKATRHHVVLALNWDGKAITGTINPGPSAVPLNQAAFDPATWLVHLEADGKEISGKSAVRYVIDGKLENIGSAQRFISGTWSEAGVKGDFKVVRN